jgi:hypothetical protein
MKGMTMKRLIATVFAVLAVLAAPAFADERSEQSGSPFANDHNFIAPAQ